MAYDRHLADRITQIVERHKVAFYEKEMMGGVTWMVDEKMSIGIYKNALMARINPEQVDTLLQRAGVEQMIHGGKAMTGYLTIQSEGFDLDIDLEFWVQKCLEFNPKAKANKKKK
jgi:TfoX/Sxy family transcriptional regulator of competence genes